MSKYGFNPKELRKTIVTQIDKDGFHNRTVVYGKDSGESESGSSDLSTAKLTFADGESTGKGYCVLCPTIVDTGNAEMGTIFTMVTFRVTHDNPVTVDIPLLKGVCYFPRGIPFTEVTDEPTFTPGLTGNVTLSGEMFVITGDATITMASMPTGNQEA